MHMIIIENMKAIKTITTPCPPPPKPPFSCDCNAHTCGSIKNKKRL